MKFILVCTHSVCHVTANIADYSLSLLLVCALRFLYIPFVVFKYCIVVCKRCIVFKHVYLWLPYASAAVGNSVANFVTEFARCFCGDRTFLHTRYLQCQSGGCQHSRLKVRRK